jgi:hypothetical protein
MAGHRLKYPMAPRCCKDFPSASPRQSCRTASERSAFPPSALYRVTGLHMSPWGLGQLQQGWPPVQVAEQAVLLGPSRLGGLSLFSHECFDMHGGTRC